MRTKTANKDSARRLPSQRVGRKGVCLGPAEPGGEEGGGLGVEGHALLRALPDALAPGAAAHLHRLVAIRHSVG
jgi:hypothetical protein